MLYTQPVAQTSLMVAAEGISPGILSRHPPCLHRSCPPNIRWPDQECKNKKLLWELQAVGVMDTQQREIPLSGWVAQHRNALASTPHKIPLQRLESRHLTSQDACQNPRIPATCRGLGVLLEGNFWTPAFGPSFAGRCIWYRWRCRKNMRALELP